MLNKGLRSYPLTSRVRVVTGLIQPANGTTGMNSEYASESEGPSIGSTPQTDAIPTLPCMLVARNWVPICENLQIDL